MTRRCLQSRGRPIGTSGTPGSPGIPDPGDASDEHPLTIPGVLGEWLLAAGLKRLAVLNDAAYIVSQGVRRCIRPPPVNRARSSALGFTEELSWWCRAVCRGSDARIGGPGTVQENSNIMPTAPHCTGAGCPTGRRTGLHLVNYHNDRCATNEDASPRDDTHVERRYFGTDVSAAIADWGGYNGRSAAERIARTALDDIAAQFGELNEVFRLEDTNRYVAAVYRPDGHLPRVGLYLSRTILESAVALPGFDAPRSTATGGATCRTSAP